MSDIPPFHVTAKTITIVNGDKLLTVTSEQPNFGALRNAIKAGQWKDALELAEVRTAIAKFSNGRVRIMEDDTFYLDQEPMHDALVERILAMLNDGYDVRPLTNFLECISANESLKARAETYGFLEACDLPITPEGYFLGYKMVSATYRDLYTGTFDNRVGARPKMDRALVDSNSDETCSDGLHVCSEGYLLSHYGKESKGHHVMIVKVNPKDVCSVPTDYNNSKMRVCEYEVVGELSNWAERIERHYSSTYSIPLVPREADALLEDDSSSDDTNEDDFMSDDLDDGNDDRLLRLLGNADEEDKEAANAAVAHALVADEAAEKFAKEFVPAITSPKPSKRAPIEPTKEQLKVIRKVRQMVTKGFSNIAIADVVRDSLGVNISPRQVGRIRSGENWAHVE